MRRWGKRKQVSLNLDTGVETLDAWAPIRQTLKLTCRACGATARYNVGYVALDPERNDEQGRPQHYFANYFRCRGCNAAGPWEIRNVWQLIALTLLMRVYPRLRRYNFGRFQLFDGTAWQTPAMGEEHLRTLIEKEPQNSFLHTRLGNLLRTSGQPQMAAPCYAEAVRLDPANLEARWHLRMFALKDGDQPAAWAHTRRIVRHLLAGTFTDPDQKVAVMATSLFYELRTQRRRWRAWLAARRAETTEDETAAFLRALLDDPRSDEEVTQHAVDQLFEPEAPPPPATEEEEVVFKPEDFVPSLRELADAEKLNPRQLSVAIRAEDQTRISIKDRHDVWVYDGKRIAVWRAPTLRELFRGNRQPPALSEMERYPADYVMAFYFIERHLLTICAAEGDRHDAELEALYANLRRRPDGKSTGPVHDALWQVAALLLAMRPFSQAEFEAVFGQLARSARHWKMGASSRNYVAFLRRNIDDNKE